MRVRFAISFDCFRVNAWWDSLVFFYLFFYFIKLLCIYIGITKGLLECCSLHTI